MQAENLLANQQSMWSQQRFSRFSFPSKKTVETQNQHLYRLGKLYGLSCLRSFLPGNYAFVARFWMAQIDLTR